MRNSPGMCFVAAAATVWMTHFMSMNSNVIRKPMEIRGKHNIAKCARTRFERVIYSHFNDKTKHFRIGHLAVM